MIVKRLLFERDVLQAFEGITHGPIEVGPDLVRNDVRRLLFDVSPSTEADAAILAGCVGVVGVVDRRRGDSRKRGRMSHRLEIVSDAPNIRQSIEFDGVSYGLELTGGVYWLLDHTGDLLLVIGRRGRWQDALRDALVFIAHRKVNG